jgi:hypothetical protein
MDMTGDNMETDINPDLYEWLRSLATVFRSDPEFRPRFLAGSGCWYATDEDGDDYVTVGYNMPKHVFAEIEDGTYGQLQGFRIYLGTRDIYLDGPVYGEET